MGSRVLALATLVALAAGPARAAEVLVPFDTRGKVLVIDAQLADRIGLFTAEHPGFSEARLFQLADSTFVLEISRRVGGSQVRDRIPLDSAGADSVRTLVNSRIVDRAPSAHYDQEARPLLLATSAVMGFGFYGWAATDLFGTTDEAAFATYMLTTAGAILIPSILTQRSNVSYPQVTLSFYGATRGIVHGALIANAVDPEGESDSDDDLAIALGVSVGEALLGYAAGTGLTPGQSAAIGLGGDLGLGYGFGGAELAGREDEERDLIVLGSAAVGLAGGYALGQWRDYSYGDVGIMRTGGFLGAFTGWALTNHDGETDDEAVIAASMAGAAVGLVVGDRIVDGAGYSFGQSVSVDFVTLSGGLIGLSIAALVESSNDDFDEQMTSTITALGAIGGYAGGIATQARGGRPARQSSLRLGVEPRWVSAHGGNEMVPHVVARLALGGAAR